jgi:hypothetical protein
VNDKTYVDLPTLHKGQLEAFWHFEGSRFNVLRCGRRWGKTVFCETLAAEVALDGFPVGYFAPEYKFVTEPYLDLDGMLASVKFGRGEGGGRKYEALRLITGGGIDFWSLDNDKAGRGRKYKRVIIDEAAFTKPGMIRTWQTVIQPTLLDYLGDAWVASNTNGLDEENFLHWLCNDPKSGFVEYHAPTSSNPMMPVEEVERLRRDTPPLVFKQEYLAEFVDWRGAMFFDVASCLVEGRPIAYPRKADAVFATIDTAVKTGREHDGVAVAYWAVDPRHGVPLALLDWDLAQIEGSLLEAWLPNVMRRLEGLAAETEARYGSLGAHIEDKVSGSILIQQAQRRDMQVHAIDSRLTAMGKDERAISVSGYVFQGKVKLTQRAFEKTVTYKGSTRNHLLTQVFGYQVGVDNKDDDILDCWCYGIAQALGNSEGF